jgi:hypothetical protein
MLYEQNCLSSTRLHLSVLKLAALLTIICSSHSVGLAKGEFNSTERWVVSKVRAGEIADLKTEFRDEARRKISSSFLVELMTNTVKGFSVPQSGISIIGAVLPDPVTIAQTIKIPFQVKLFDCQFQNEVTINAVHFLERLVITKSVFDKRANFSELDVTGNLVANEVSFKGPVSFNGAKIGGAAHLEGATFDGPTDFISASIGIAFIASGASFNYRPTKIGTDLLAVSFNTMKVGGSAFVDDTTFKSSADFSYLSTIYNLDAHGAQFLSPELIAFRYMTIGGNVFLDKAVFNGGADFKSTTIGKSLSGNDTQFNNAEWGVSFSGMKLDTFQFNPATINNEKKLAGPLRLDAMSYQRFNTATWNDLVWLANRAGEVSRDIFTSLETCYRRQGYLDHADEIYILGKQHEREGHFGIDPLGYLWNLIQDKTAGYGRDLKRALIFSIGFIIIGSIVFWRETGMVTQKDDDAGRYNYHPVWYSIALFLPIISLEDAKVWMPKKARRFARFYMRLHIILGYLLIPIAVAAWTFPLLSQK